MTSPHLTLSILFPMTAASQMCNLVIPAKDVTTADVIPAGQ